MSQNLLFNTRKTKIMVVDKDRERKEDFVLDGEKIEEVESFVYLGSLINTKGSSTQEIRRRQAMGRGAEHGVDMEEQRYEFGTQTEIP